MFGGGNGPASTSAKVTLSEIGASLVKLCWTISISAGVICLFIFFSSYEDSFFSSPLTKTHFFTLGLLGGDHALQVLDGLPFAIWGKTQVRTLASLKRRIWLDPILPAIYDDSACFRVAERGIVHRNASVSGVAIWEIIHRNLCREVQTTTDEESTQCGCDGFFPVAWTISCPPVADAVVAVTIFQQHFPSTLAMECDAERDRGIFFMFDTLGFLFPYLVHFLLSSSQAT